MALIRCTCIYRASTQDELDAGGASISVLCYDPHCSALPAHHRAQQKPPSTLPTDVPDQHKTNQEHPA